MELFTIAPKKFEEEIAHYDLRLREVIRAYPPNRTYRVKNADKRSPFACGLIVGYGLLDGPIADVSGGFNKIPVVRMAFLCKPMRDEHGFMCTQVVDDIPASALVETADTPESWYERVYKHRHPMTWLDLVRVGMKQTMIEQGTAKQMRVADAAAVDAAAGKES